MLNVQTKLHYALFFLVLAVSGYSQAPEYPARPIKVIVPFAAGSGSDTFVRIIAKAIRDENLLPQPLVVINVEGAGGTIGSRRVKNARPDGYTVLALHEAIITAKHAGRAPYGPESFEAIAGTGQIGIVIAAAENSSYQDLPGLMEAAKSNPETIVMGANLGAPSHFVGLLLENAYPGARFRFTQTGGGASRLSSLTGGHIELSVFSVEEFLRYESAGIKALAYFGETRHPKLPELPTASEQGVPVLFSNTIFWWFPKLASEDRIQVFATALEAAMKTPYVRSQLEKSLTLPLFLKGEELATGIEARSRSISAASLRKTSAVPNFPLWVGLATGALLVGAMARRFRLSHADPTAHEDAGTGAQLKLAWICYGFAAIYVALLASGLISYPWATVIFVLSVGALLAKRSLFNLSASGLLALSLGFGLFYIFTQLLIIDLPG